MCGTVSVVAERSFFVPLSFQNSVSKTAPGALQQGDLPGTYVMLTALLCHILGKKLH